MALLHAHFVVHADETQSLVLRYHYEDEENLDEEADEDGDGGHPWHLGGTEEDEQKDDEAHAQQHVDELLQYPR